MSPNDTAGLRAPVEPDVPEDKRGAPSPWRLLAEKAALLILSVVFVAITFVVQQGAITLLDKWPLTARLANVVVAYAEHLVQVVVPANLGVLYTIPPEG